jgi:hypothetical protein
MSRRGKKLSKAEKEARRPDKDAQELDALVKDTAAAFRSSFEIVEDSATECERRRADLEADLKYRRLPTKSGAAEQAQSQSHQPWQTSSRRTSGTSW